jgi:site-specific DNA-methyltransferase (adenine-specific)
MSPRIEHLAEGVTLYLGDCREILPSLGKVDAVVTDPPYGTTACAWDCVINPAPLWDAFDRMLSDRGAAIFFGCQPFTSQMVVSRLEWFKYQWVWDKVSKTDFMNAKNKPLREHEDIIVFSKGTTANKSPRRMTYNPQGIAEPTRFKSDNRNAAGYMGCARPSHEDHYTYQAANYPSSILRFSNADRGDVEHPTQKPIELLRFLVSTYSDEEQTILDPFMGSGTTGVAAVKLGRKFTGIEIEPKYFDIACRRISEALKQPDMFIEKPKAAEQQRMEFT